jgi:hypothetical protein
MAKDPAFLFYYQDFLVGSDDMTNEEVGAYIRCLCHQASKGSVTEKHMKKICMTSDVHEIVKSKFEVNDEGNFINQRLSTEILRRVAFSESRRNNRLKKTSDKDMMIISNSYDKHMETETETETENINTTEIVTKRKKFLKPNEDDLYNFMGELNSKGNNFLSDARLISFVREFIDYYEGNGWKIGKNPMKDWQSTARRWMRNEYDKTNNQKPNTYGKHSNTTSASIATAQQLYADAVAISRARNQAEQNQSSS